MKVRRDANSIPGRSASATWQAIKDLITGKDSEHSTDLDAIAGVMGSIITDEHPAKEPLILHGVGPRLVIYCKYGSDAITGDDNLSPLSWNPTAGDWQLKVPCDAENLAWVRAALAKKSKRVLAYDVEHPEAEGDKQESTAAKAIEIDWSAGGSR